MLPNQTLDPALLLFSLPVPVVSDAGTWEYSESPTAMLGGINADGTGTIYFNTEVMPAIEESVLEFDVTFTPEEAASFSDSFEIGSDELVLAGLAVEEGGFVTAIYSASQGGSVEGELTQVIPTGSSGTEVTAVPAEGYSFYKWTDNITSPSRTNAGLVDSKVTALFALSSDDVFIFSQYKE
jgi:hypothetical protein